MGKLSRDKGKSGERAVAEILRENGFPNARRGVQYKGGEGSPDVIGLPGYRIEVKRVESLSLYKAMKQANAEKADHEIPVVVHRRSNEAWVAILPLVDFLALVKKRAVEDLEEMLG